ncbi:MAG: DUF362 domain-containing protein, partial [Lawsonibacter sp.]|nr:DUF362 domain-containing protein [Lawsonibacter sp.]
IAEEVIVLDRQIYVTTGKDYAAMTMALMERADIAVRIPAGAKVALKPNLVVGVSPSQGATTHREILEGAIRYLQGYGVTNLSIMEGSWVGDATERGFAACGYDTLSAEYGVPLYDLKKDATIPVQTQVGTIRICKRALDTDYLINLPVLKGHCQTTMTCALKNCKGCLPDAEKRHFHAMGLMKPIAALAAVLRPSLTIVDNICGDLNFEEGGNPVPTHRIFMGEDMVQLDTYGCRLMGIDTDEVPYIALAQQYGAGSMALEETDIVRLNEEGTDVMFGRPSGIVGRLTKNVTDKSACSACYGNLIHALYRKKEKNGPYTGPIAIGQEFAGKSFDGVGIGRCCAGAACPVAGCPPTATEILGALERAEAENCHK